MRLDKYLKVSRIIKRRTVASEACEQGKVSVNGKIAKPSTAVKEGDIIEVSFGEVVNHIENAFSANDGNIRKYHW